MASIPIPSEQSRAIEQRVAAKFAENGVDPKRIKSGSWALNSDGDLTAEVFVLMSPEEARDLFNGGSGD